jgi:F-type H+-transporting ATPase subunit a
MAGTHDPILHIKDSYYFEVPKFMWQRHYKSYEEVPQFILAHYPENQRPTLEQFDEALSGKILLYPQPFGELKNLYEPKSGFCISKFMIIELVVAILLLVIFTSIAHRMPRGAPLRGRFWNFFEAILLFFRDQVARPAIGGHASGHHGDAGHAGQEHGHDAHAIRAAQRNPYAEADLFLPLIWTLFFFILFCNLMGMLPWVGAPTSAWGATLALACVTLLSVFVGGIAKFGPLGFWANQVPAMDLPIWLWPLKPIIFVIEVASLLIKHAVLSIRLLANMVAGHLVLLGILGLILGVAEASIATYSAVASVSVLGTTALNFLELFVAFLQAYVFTLLSALFIGAAVHSH